MEQLEPPEEEEPGPSMPPELRAFIEALRLLPPVPYESPHFFCLGELFEITGQHCNGRAMDINGIESW